MKKLIFTLVSILVINISFSQEYNIINHFSEVYKDCPSIPKGLLEAVSFSKSRMKHLNGTQENCNGMPKTIGIMGIILDGKGYFYNNIDLIVYNSGINKEIIIKNPYYNILSYAKTLENITQNKGDIYSYIDALYVMCELPKGNVTQNYSRDSEIYSILKLLKNKKFMRKLGYKTIDINLKKVFADNLNILTSSKVIISDSHIYNVSGEQYKSSCNDYPNSSWVSSPNFNSRNGIAITDITIHTIQGSYAGCISWFQNPNAQVSAHYVIRSSDGQITQMVCESDRAWHVGSENDYTIGIEHEGYVNDPIWYTDSMYNSSADLVKDIILGGYGINPLSCYMNSYQGVVNSCYHIKGHVHFPNQTHTDPGIFWDYQKYYNLINDHMNIVIDTNIYGLFTDSGGVIGTYESFQSYMTVISPTNADSVILTFTQFDLELDYDTMSIYDGTDTSGILIGSYTGTTSPGTVVGTSGSLSIVFYSDCLYNNAGWSANWNSVFTPLEIDNKENKKNILKIIDILGKVVDNTSKGIHFYIFDDGTVEKKIIIE